MSRVEYNDFYDGAYTYEMQCRTLMNATSGRRGQAAVRLLVDALDALPVHRLIADYVQRGGEVCAVGALVVQARVNAGLERTVALASLPAGDNVLDWEVAALATEYVNIAHTLAWRMVEINDEDTAGMTPEERWQYVRDWAVSQLHEEARE